MECVHKDDELEWTAALQHHYPQCPGYVAASAAVGSDGFLLRDWLIPHPYALLSSLTYIFGITHKEFVLIHHILFKSRDSLTSLHYIS